MEIRKDGEITVVLLDSRFDTFTSKDVEVKLMELVDGGARKLVCDFSNTEYISSAGLRVMLVIAKKLQQSGGKVALACLKPFVLDIFKMSGFTQIFDIHETKEQAVASLL